MVGGAFKDLLTGAIGGAVGSPLGESAGKLAQAGFGALFGGTWNEVTLHARGYLDRPLNHDLERSLRFAALVGCLVVVNEQARQDDADRIAARDHRPDAFAPAARRWLHAEFAALERVPHGAHADAVALLETTLDTALMAARDGRDAAEAAARRRAAEAAMWREVIASPAAAHLPEDFEARFRSADPDRPGWFACFVAFLREALKDRPDARVAFFVSRVVALRNGVRRVGEALAAIHATGERTERKVEAVDAKLERVLALLDARGDTARAAEAGLDRATILALARRLKPEEVADLDQAVAALEYAVEVALRTIARSERGTNHDAFVDRVLGEVAALNRGAEFDRAGRALDESLAELDRREAEERERTRRARVALLEAGVDQDILRGDATAVAARIEAILRAEGHAERPAWAPGCRERWDIFWAEGEAKGVALWLRIAAAMADRMLASARDADERGDAGNRLGAALLRLGDRGDDAAMCRAAAAFEAALKERTRDRVPLDWAMTQNNLGNAFLTLGERGDDAALRRAVAAYEAALEERTRERVPLDWAATQTNLGNALQALGDRGDDAVLRQAVAAYEAALEERTRDRVPLDWAMTQNNLGNALLKLGKRGDDAALRRAVAAYEAALEESTRERVPLDWAMTQNNLGNAFLTLGARGDDAALRRAVAACEAALEERTRERMPLDWAATQNNLGNALTTLGERGDDAALRRAVAAYEAALEEHTRERVPLDWAATQNNLGAALVTLGRRGDDAALRRSVAAFEAALEERTRERAPYPWAITIENLAEAEESLAERLGEPARLRRALALTEGALEEYVRFGATYDMETATRLRDRLRAKLAGP